MAGIVGIIHIYSITLIRSLYVIECDRNLA